MALEVGPAGLSHKNVSQVRYLRHCPPDPWMLPNLIFLSNMLARDINAYQRHVRFTPESGH